MHATTKEKNIVTNIKFDDQKPRKRMIFQETKITTRETENHVKARFIFFSKTEGIVMYIHRWVLRFFFYPDERFSKTVDTMVNVKTWQF